jgi:hypothetical protein
MDLVGKPHHEQEAATEAWNLASDEGGGGASLFCNREELGAWKRGMNCECGNGEEGQGGGVPFIGPIEGAKAVAVAGNGASMHRQFREVGRRVGAVLWSKWGRGGGVAVIFEEGRGWGVVAGDSCDRRWRGKVTRRQRR